MRFRQVALAMAALTSTALVSGCGGGADGRTAATAPAAPPRASASAGTGGTAGAPGQGGGSAFRAQGLVISAWCTVPASRPATVTVRGFDPSSWQVVATAEFTLPPTVAFSSASFQEPSALTQLCGTPGQAATPDDTFGPRVRRLFDRDFSKLAVVTSDAKTGATHVGYVDRAGKFTDLTGDATGFGSTLKEQDPQFAPDGDAVWFTYTDGSGKDHIASRPLSGSHQLADLWTGSANGRVNLAVGGDPLRGVIGNRLYFSPDGKRVVGYVDGEGANAVPLTATGMLPASATPIPIHDLDCAVSGWVDNHTVLCAYSPGAGRSADGKDYTNNLWTEDVDRMASLDWEHGKEAAGPLLLPATDRTNRPVAISPDGKRVLFRSTQGKTEQAYVTDLAPGGQPQQITAKDAADALGSLDVVLEWR
jgi:hypothetical protein